MRYCKYILLTISVVLGLFACQKDEDVTIAQLNIKNEVITPSYTSADIECWIECNVKFNQAKVECALTQDFQSPIVVAMEQSKGKYVAQVVDLQYDTTYYVRYIISNRMSAMTYDKIKSFKTLKPSVPTVQLDSVANIWDVTANACAQIIKDGGLPVTEWGICLKVSTGADSLFMKADSQSLSQQIVCAGLQPNTTYRVHAYAKNAVGTGYSEERTFTTFALPTVETKDVSNIKLTTALLSGMLVFNGNDSATVKGFCWGLKTNPTIDGNQVVVDTVSNAYTYLLSNLKDETKYYVRAYARNKIGVTYGEEKTFTTQAAVVPVVSTTAASSITSVSAKVGGNVTADGGAEVTERGICYSTTKNPTTASTKLASGKGMGSYVCDLTGLQANTTYYVRAYAINKKGTAYGEEVTFTTNKNIVPPTVTTSAVTQITETTAVAGGNVTADGGASVTERGVVYSTSQNPTTANTKKVSGSGTGAFTCNLTGLQASTTYYVRAYAINEKGTSYGEQVTFKTLEEVSATPEYVDLGLSVKWADRNVGASKPEEYGDYFAWGETEPKSIYDWSTYKWCNGNSTTLTKYNNSSSYGTVDNKTQLELSDDAARANWGGSWRMPTEAEQEELRANCTWTWTTQNGVKGYKVTSKKSGYTNKSIFLPAAGFLYDSSLGYASSNGSYWSSSLSKANSSSSCSMGFSSSDVTWGHNYRYYGRSVRPVYGEYVPEINLPVITTSTITQIAETTAVAGGNVTSDGGATVTERGVVYSTTANPTTANTKKVSGSGTGMFTCNLTGLQASTTYYVRAYAINEKGTSYGEQVTFKTLTPIVPPTVTTSAVTQITETTAVAGGNVTADGGASVTERGVVYSTTANPTTANTKKVSGSGTGAFTCNLTGLQASTTYYVRAYAINEKGTAYGEQVTFKTLEEVSATPEYVDLGLSVKWADRNVGASKPEEYGDYFAWGETEPKSSYDWSTYKWCNGSYTTQIKYCTNSNYGTVDNKTTLELSDDAARAHWGGNWRMPTRAEQDELCNNCTWTWTTQNGVNGYKVTSKSNGNSIFLPAAGCRIASSPNNAGSMGYYCSSSLYTDYPYNVWGVEFRSDRVYRDNDFRYFGFSVRPVYGEYIPASTMPTVTTSAVTQITETTAVAGGNVTSDGGASVTERGVVYSTTANPTTANTKKVSGSGTGAFTCNLTGLQASTTYYVRAYAINEKGTAYGEQVTFKTLTPIVPPTVTTSAVTQITETTAVAGGNVTSDGGASVTERGVVYSTTANPTTANTKKVSGSGTGAFTCNLTGLQASTTYYVRAYAINEKGTAYGEQVTFKTLTPIVPPTVTTSAVTQITETTAVAGGNVTADGGASVTERGVVYSTTANPTTANTKKVSGSGTGAFTCNMSGLLAGTTYYVRAYAINEKGTAYGEEVSFVTKNLSSSIYVPTNEELWEIFKPYYNTYYDLWRADLPIGMVSTFAGSKMLEIMTDSESGFKWLGDYIMQVSAEQGYSLDTEKSWRWAVHSFFNCNQQNSYPYSADFTIAGQPAAWGAAYQAAYNEGRTVTIILETSSVTESYTTALVDCEIIYSSDMTITERGVVYGTIQKPTISNSKVTSGSGTGSFTCNLTGLQAGTMYYVRSYAINEKGIAYGRQVTFTTKAEVTTGTENGYEWVDLGLSVKWATINVGATKPEEYGDYFAWGETEPKEVYDWSTYKWCNGSQNTLTKYNHSSSCGTVDNKTQLELSDDAARVNWGGDWRMPTHVEQDELRNNCTWTWTTQNGVNGYKVTSKSNGNSIFLPAAGSRSDSGLNGAGSYGNYWSSSLNTDGPRYAYSLDFNSSGVDWYGGYRYCGFSVRPVCQ